MIRCSVTTFHGFTLCSLAMLKLRILSWDRPQITLTAIAVESLNSKTGIINVNAKTNLDKKVERVDSHISFDVCLFSDSSEI